MEKRTIIVNDHEIELTYSESLKSWKSEELDLIHILGDCDAWDVVDELKRELIEIFRSIYEGYHDPYEVPEEIKRSITLYFKRPEGSKAYSYQLAYLDVGALVYLKGDYCKPHGLTFGYETIAECFNSRSLADNVRYHQVVSDLKEALANYGRSNLLESEQNTLQWEIDRMWCELEESREKEED